MKRQMLQWRALPRPTTLFGLLYLHVALHSALATTPSTGDEGYRIAIIGGGIGGTFAAKYLAEYDVHHRGENQRSECLLREIVVFDVSPPPGETASSTSQGDDSGTNTRSSSDPRPRHSQGSRVSSLTLRDGSVIELGASIIYSGNQLVVEMMKGDSEYLVRGKPMGLGNKKVVEKAHDGTTKQENTDNKQEPSGFGIYHGDQQWLLNPSIFSSFPSMLRSILKPVYFMWRYNFDYFRLQRAVKQAVRAFDIVYALLHDTEKDVTYFENPMDMWSAIGLKSLAGISFHAFLDELGLSRDTRLELSRPALGGEVSWWRNWRRWFPGMGCLRSELVTAMTINTYNQDLNEMNGLVGLVAYVPAGGDLFSIEGGNYKLMTSAIRQANKMYETSNCSMTAKLPRVQRHQKTITTLVSSEEYMELFSNDESLGSFDIVILGATWYLTLIFLMSYCLLLSHCLLVHYSATPLQMCRIRFLMHSPMNLDSAILHEMPLTGVHDNVDPEDINHVFSTSSSTRTLNNEHGERSFAGPLPPSATTPYTSVVTTIISNVTFNASHFGLSDDMTLPRTILVSERGRLLGGITTLRILSAEKKLVKTFSTEPLDKDALNVMFGPHHVVDYVQLWGGGNNSEFSMFGGATPSFRGGHNSESLPYLLYDGAAHWGKSTGPALYYVNAIESAVAAIEISAIGAKSTAKLVARRVGLITPRSVALHHEEL